MKILTLNNQSMNQNFCSINLGQNSYNAQNANPYWLNQTPTDNITVDNTINQPTTKPINKIGADAATGATGIAVILRAVQYGIEQLSELCAQMLMRGKEFAAADDVKKVANAMKADNGLIADIHYIDNSNKGFLKKMFPGLAKSLDTVANGANAFYTRDGGFAVAPKSKPSLMLHELGHAINFEKSKLFRGLQKLKVLGMYAPMALVFLNDITGKRKDGKQSFIERNAGVIGFSAFLPTIIEEAAASVRGIKAAKKVLPKANLGPLKRNYFLAWMTYLLAGVGVGVASKLVITENNLPNKESRKRT